MTLLGNPRLWLPALLLAGFGLINVYSASMPIAMERYGDPMFFFKRQALWIVLGALAFGLTLRVPLEWWRQLAPLMFLTLFFLLVLMKFAGLGVDRNGAVRWIDLGAVSLQPSEFAKPLLAVYLARVFSTNIFQDRPTWGHYVGVILVVGALMAMVAIQPDFGGAVLLGIVFGTVLFAAGAPPALLGGLVVAAYLTARAMLLAGGYKTARVAAFLDPWAHSRETGFQLIQSYLALGNGGLTGRGIGLGMQKLFYLPEAHTDFIFSVIGEEWGFLGTIAVLMAIGWLLYEIYGVAHRAEGDRFGQFVAMGVLAALGVAYLFNLAVATGLLPTKGLALPLISYGGSALLATAVALGLVARVDLETQP